MDFSTYINDWARSEVIQASIMIGVGVLFVAAFVGILRSEGELLRGALVPMGFIILILIGYGGYILYSRPAHAKASIARFQQSEKEAIEQEKVKHINDNKAGKTLLKIYPILAILALLALIFVPSPYFKGMALGFAAMFIMIYVIDTGFVTRSDAFLEFLSELQPSG